MTKHTTQLETAILDGFAEGCSLRAMCQRAGVSRSAFLRWLHGNPDLARRYEDAQILHAQALVDDCVAIADDPTVALGEGRPGDAVDAAGMIRHARFRIEARLKVARIYFKRHEAALARRMETEESPVHPVAATETSGEPATAEPSEPTVACPPNRRARRAAKASARRAAPLGLASIAPALQGSARQLGDPG